MRQRGAGFVVRTLKTKTFGLNFGLEDSDQTRTEQQQAHRDLSPARQGSEKPSPLKKQADVHIQGASEPDASVVEANELEDLAEGVAHPTEILDESQKRKRGRPRKVVDLAQPIAKKRTRRTKKEMEELMNEIPGSPPQTTSTAPSIPDGLHKLVANLPTSEARVVLPGTAEDVVGSSLPAYPAAASTPEARKRGRPRKVISEEETQRKAEEGQVLAGTTVGKKKRGRPRKVPEQTVPTAPEDSQATPVRKRGRPRKIRPESTEHIEKPVDPGPVTVKKRGRPRKTPVEQNNSTTLDEKPTDIATPSVKKRGRPRNIREGEDAVTVLNTIAQAALDEPEVVAPADTHVEENPETGVPNNNLHRSSQTTSRMPESTNPRPQHQQASRDTIMALFPDDDDVNPAEPKAHKRARDHDEEEQEEEGLHVTPKPPTKSTAQAPDEAESARQEEKVPKRRGRPPKPKPAVDPEAGVVETSAPTTDSPLAAPRKRGRPPGKKTKTTESLA